jgi:hypothetical protein
LADAASEYADADIFRAGLSNEQRRHPVGRCSGGQDIVNQQHSLACQSRTSAHSKHTSQICTPCRCIQRRLFHGALAFDDRSMIEPAPETLCDLPGGGLRCLVIRHHSIAPVMWHRDHNIRRFSCKFIAMDLNKQIGKCRRQQFP